MPEPIVVDIGAAMQLLESNPDLAQKMNELAFGKLAADQLAEQEDEIAKLRSALTFYADVSKYPAPLTGGMGALLADCGQIARDALADRVAA